MSQQNPYAPPKAVVADVVSSEVAPALWNPNAAACWSLLFSPIFGAFLHMRNWEALGRPEMAAKSKEWVIGSVLFYGIAVVAPFVLPASSFWGQLGRIGGIALLISWYYSIGKSQQTFVSAQFGKSYPRRGWLKPIAAAIGFMLAFLMAILVLAFVVAVGRGMS